MFQTVKSMGVSFLQSLPSLSFRNQNQQHKKSDLLERMTLEEKVGQLFVAHFRGEVANEDAKNLIQDVKVGGIIYYNWSNGLTSPEQARELSAGLQALSQQNRIPIPLLISADQEGGVVIRLNNGFTIFPGNKALGMTGNPKLAEEAALATGKELRAVGINMNLAPVVDVNSEPRNPVIGIRAFSDSPETVLAFGKMALSGYNQAHTIATLKHFPGHGDVLVDSHENLPVNQKSVAELEHTELLPFDKLASSVDAIMTAHILVPALDPKNCATLSPKILAYLKDKIGFKGVIIADSLVMEGVLKKCKTVDEAAIQALNAGCDILMLGGKQLISDQTDRELTVADIQRIHHSIVDAVKKGRVTEDRLNQAVEKILQLKEKYLSSKPPIIQSDDIRKFVNTEEHRALAQKIASRALKVIQNEPISSLHQKNVFVLAPQVLRNSMEKTSVLNIGKTTDSFFFKDLNPSSSEIETAKMHAKAADVLLVCSYNSWKNPLQEALIQSLLGLGKPVILFVTRDPLDALLFPKANMIFNTYSPTAPSIQAACDYLEEHTKGMPSRFFSLTLPLSLVQLQIEVNIYKMGHC